MTLLLTILLRALVAELDDARWRLRVAAWNARAEDPEPGSWPGIGGSC